MEQIVLAYGLPKETVAAIIMLNKNTEVKVCTPDGDKLLWHCCWCSAREYISPISVHNLPRRWTLNIDRSNERKWSYTKKARIRQYPVQTITDTDYADDIALLANTLTQAGSLLHSLEQAALASLSMQTKMECMCFNKKGDISTLKGGSLKLVDKFTYLGSRVSSMCD